MGALCKGYGFIEVVIHFELKSGKQQGVSLILSSKLNEQSTPQNQHLGCKTSERRRVCELSDIPIA